MNKTITIKDKNSPWKIIEKKDDMSCVLKYINSDDTIKGEILSISSNGKYTIGVKEDGKDKLKK
jgi:hypothetical protein